MVLRLDKKYTTIANWFKERIDMAWIKEIDVTSNDLLKKIYEAAESRAGETVANVLKVHGIYSPILKAHIALYECIMFEASELTRQPREMIGVVVSKANACPYCVEHHG